MLAILYDVHGNLRALEAVLEDVEAHGAQRFVLGGDYAAFGMAPAACVARLEALPDAIWLRGNWERWAAEGAPDDATVQGAAAFVRAALGDELVARHGRLPTSAERAGILFCHASPLGDMDGFAAKDPAPGEDERLLDGATARRVVFGHTHLQFARTSAAGVELVNPGSVGLPVDGDRRAAYALLGDDGSLALHRVAYDDEAAAAELEALGEPWAARTAARLRAASFDV